MACKCWQLPQTVPYARELQVHPSVTLGTDSKAFTISRTGRVLTVSEWRVLLIHTTALRTRNMCVRHCYRWLPVIPSAEKGSDAPVMPCVFMSDVLHMPSGIKLHLNLLCFMSSTGLPVAEILKPNKRI